MNKGKWKNINKEKWNNKKHGKWKNINMEKWINFFYKR